MRSETVVLPASMWAAMPIFRTLVKSRAMGFLTSLDCRLGGGPRGVSTPKAPGLTRSRGRGRLTLTTLCFGQHEPARTARSSRGLLLETDTSRYRYYGKTLHNVCRKRAISDREGEKSTGGRAVVKCLKLGPLRKKNTPVLFGRGCCSVLS